MIYGEGIQTFIRLQKSITSEAGDLTIFTWASGTNQSQDALWAHSPDAFATCGSIITDKNSTNVVGTVITNVGLRTMLPLMV